jgi:hypothetical protein
MKSVEVCTQDGEEMALDGTDCTEKMVEYGLSFSDHWTRKVTSHDTPVHMYRNWKATGDPAVTERVRWSRAYGRSEAAFRIRPATNDPGNHGVDG